MATPYETVTAFSHAGKLFPTEHEALLSAITAELQSTTSPAMPERIYASASALLPLLKRAVELQSSVAAVELLPAGWRGLLGEQLRRLEDKEEFTAEDGPEVAEFLAEFATRNKNPGEFTVSFRDRVHHLMVRDAYACANVPGYIQPGGK